MGRSCIQHSDLAIDIRTTLGAPVHVAVVHNVRRAVSIVVLEEVKVAVQRLRNTHILLHNRKRPSHVDDLLRVSRNTQFLNCTRKEGRACQWATLLYRRCHMGIHIHSIRRWCTDADTAYPQGLLAVATV